MGTSITIFDLYEACYRVIDEMRRDGWIPIDTGNMAYNAVVVEMASDTEIRIYIDKSIAPYAVDTERPWVAPRWHGRKNPNEGWWERLREEFARRLARVLGGEL